MPSTAPGSGTPVLPDRCLIDDPQAANRNLANTISKECRDELRDGALTADIANAVDVIVPSANIHLFLEGIQQAPAGDPMGTSSTRSDTHSRGRRGTVHSRRRSSALDHHARAVRLPMTSRPLSPDRVLREL